MLEFIMSERVILMFATLHSREGHGVSQQYERTNKRK